MKIVQSEGSFIVYRDGLQTYDALPTGTYKVDYDQDRGYFLTQQENPVNTERIYGNVNERVQKILNTFKALSRNMGVILSGQKGSGKTLTAKVLMEKARQCGIPTLLVDKMIPDLASYLTTIDQECIVLFDEFEKTFPYLSSKDAQSPLLPLFDGVQGGRKLFVLSCTDIQGLSPYMLDRPGRFHYHFTANALQVEDIHAYLHDNLRRDRHGCIEEVVRMAYLLDMTYDILRAVVCELNLGYGLEETWRDLNIQAKRQVKLVCRCDFANNITTADTLLMLDLDNLRLRQYLLMTLMNVPKHLAPYIQHVAMYYQVEDLHLGINGFELAPEDVQISFPDDWEDVRNNPELVAEIEAWIASCRLKAISIKKGSVGFSSEIANLALQTHNKGDMQNKAYMDLPFS